MAEISVTVEENTGLTELQEEISNEEQTDNAVEVKVTNDNGIDAELLAETEETSGDADAKEEVKGEEEMLAEEDEEQAEDQEEDPVDLGEEDAGDGDDDEDEEELEEEKKNEEKPDPNVMPQVNVAVLAKRKWQVKVYPLKPADFTSGLISKVFKSARESLLYLMTGQYSRGKGEMYIQSVQESVKVVQSLMMLDSHFQEINIEVVRKNSEGAIQEKASMRFDTKMVRMLFVGPTNPFNNRNPGRGLYGKMNGRKRERLIGSVFVKNLPPGTTKNMLRVMFPFAQEINYNPEKYTEGTARLVLKTRSTVIPCLKAFAKVELGGNILELHPLEKPAHLYEKNPAKKRHAASDQKPRSASKSDKEGKGEVSELNSESKSSEDLKKETTNQNKQSSESKSEDKQEEKEESPKKKESAKKNGDNKKPQDRKPGQQQKRLGPGGQQKNRQGPPGKKFNNKDKFANNKDFAARKSFGDNRTGFKKTGFNKTGFNNNPNRFAGAAGLRQVGARSQQQGYGNNRIFASGDLRKGPGGRGRGANNRRPNLGLAAGTELVQKAEATKDMMILQSQLNMAIKSQLAMLNQTQRAVAEAKRGASSLGLGSSSLGLGGASAAVNRGSMSQLTDTRREDTGFADRSRSRDRAAHLDHSGGWGSYGGKRSAAQADLEEDYGVGSFSSKRSGLQRSAGQYSQGRAVQQARGVQHQGRGVQQTRTHAQTRVLQNQQRRAVAEERLRSSAYDDDLYRQNTSSYGVRDRVEDPYDSYGTSARSYSAAATSLDAHSAARSQLYDNDSYGYRY